MVALMKRLSLSAEDKERSAAVSEIVDLVKKGGVAALKVCPSLILLHHASQLLAVWERMLSACLNACSEDCRQTQDGVHMSTYTFFSVRVVTCS